MTGRRIATPMTQAHRRTEAREDRPFGPSSKNRPNRPKTKEQIQAKKTSPKNSSPPKTVPPKNSPLPKTASPSKIVRSKSRTQKQFSCQTACASACASGCPSAQLSQSPTCLGPISFILRPHFRRHSRYLLDS